MKPDLDTIIIDRSDLQKAILVETLRIELSDLGFTVVRTEWLQRKLVNEQIRLRRLEDAG
jgi:hypothetical protein